MLNLLNVDIVLSIIIFISLLLGTLIAVAYYTLLERHVLSQVQRRKGPNFSGALGSLQPLADGLKLMAKEGIVPSLSIVTVYFIAPIFSLIISFCGWTLLPVFFENPLDINSDLDIILFFCLTSIGTYGVVLAGWGSYSRYAVLGSLRAIAQLISYEVIFLLTILPCTFFVGSFSFIEFHLVQSQADCWLLWPTLPNALIFFILMLAETNRTPFDLPEAEAELVSGFNVEYSSILFAMFSLAEYNSMLLMSTLFVILFLGAWVEGIFIFIFKVLAIAYLIIKVRAALPRYRYDQLMFLCWYIFLPLSVATLVFIFGICQYFTIIYYNPNDLLLDIIAKYSNYVFNL